MRHVLGSLARRWLLLHEEIKIHSKHLKKQTKAAAPRLVEAVGVGLDIAAEMLITAGDISDRVRSEAAFAKMCGAYPIPAGSGKTNGGHRLYRGGNRQANAALYRAVIVRMRWHQPTIDYVERRTAEGLSKREIIRCLIAGLWVRGRRTAGRGSSVVSGDGLVAAPCRTASLSTATPDAPRPQTGVRDMPDRGPNNEEPGEGLDTVESITDPNGG